MFAVRARTLSPVALALGDAAAIVLWAVIGLHGHDDGVTAVGLLRSAGFVLVGWFAAAAVLRSYARCGPQRFLLTWGTGVTLGVLVRWIALLRPVTGDELVFLGVTLVVTLAMLLAWRGLAWAMARAGGTVRRAPG